MDNTTVALSRGTQGETAAPPDNDGGSDSFTAGSSTIAHPEHQVAKAVTSLLRILSLLLLVGGVAGAIVWRFAFRQPGALHDSASGVVFGPMIGSVIVAALVAALAFVVDLLFRTDWDAKFVPTHLDERP
jgi:hypothetical protein